MQLGSHYVYATQRNALRILNQNTFPADPQSTQNTIYWQNKSVKALEALIHIPAAAAA